MNSSIFPTNQLDLIFKNMSAGQCRGESWNKLGGLEWSKDKTKKVRQSAADMATVNQPMLCGKM